MKKIKKVLDKGEIFNKISLLSSGTALKARAREAVFLGCFNQTKKGLESVNNMSIYNKESIIEKLNDKNMVYCLPFFPGIHYTDLDPYELKYYELDMPKNKVYFLAKYGDNIDFENELEIDFDQYCEDIGKLFVSFLSETLPPWIKSITYSHISTSSNYSQGDLYANIIFTSDLFEKILSFLKENFDYCEKRVQELYHTYWDKYSHNDMEHFGEWIKFFENPWLGNEPHYYITNCENCSLIIGVTRLWYELNFNKRESSTVDNCLICSVLENIGISKYLVFKPADWIDEEKRESIREENKKLNEENYSDYEHYKKRFSNS